MRKEKFKYPIEVFWSDEDKGYIAIVPDLPGCSAWGATEEEALREVHDAAHAWLKVAIKMKREIPQPSTEANYSGKFLMRVPKRLHAELARAAKAQGVSLNQYILYLLAEKNTKHGSKHTGGHAAQAA